MKHLKTYNLFESNDGFGNDDKVMILYKLPGTEERELMPVRIIKREPNSNSYLVSFNVEGNPYSNHADMVVKSSKLVGPYHQIEHPMSPSLTSSQPTPTDYNSAGNIGGGGVSNDVVLPSS